MLLVCTGCATVSDEFIVDTSLPDPVIYGPGTQPHGPLHIPLEGFDLSCDEVAVKIGEVIVTVAKRLWGSTQGVRQLPVVEIPAEAVLALALGDSASLYSDLVWGLSDLNRCQLTKPQSKTADVAAQHLQLATKPNSQAAELAAQHLQLALPRPYSAVLRTAYNHRVWKEHKGTSTRAITVDMLPGMRLRIENSLPISPSGIQSEREHPSSFAAPTYIYFHVLSGRELCDPRSSVNESSAKFLCSTNSADWEAKMFVSAASGLARLGLRQTEDHVISGPNQIPAYQTSSLIDLLERIETGEGAWRYWRLWLPVQRNTAYTKPLSEKGGGSAEDRNSTPLLIAGSSLADLNGLAYGTPTPCKAPGPYRCHSLRYRVVPVPEFMLHVNGQRQWVPIGTTLADILADRLQDGFSAHPYFFWAENKQGEPADTALFAASTARRVLNTVAVRRMQAGRKHGIAPISLASDDDVRRFLRLQLVPGDEVTWR